MLEWSSVTRSLGEGKHSKIRAARVNWAGSVLGAEFGLHALGDFAHICTALKQGL